MTFAMQACSCYGFDMASSPIAGKRRRACIVGPTIRADHVNRIECIVLRCIAYCQLSTRQLLRVTLGSRHCRLKKEDVWPRGQ